MWSRGGGELFYVGAGYLWGMQIETEPTLTWQDPVRLFETPGPTEVTSFVNYDVTSDGQQFVFVQPLEEADLPQINVVLNWFEELKARVPIP